MDKLTQDVRLENWTSIIEQCESRPEGQSKKEWLDLNGISEKQYYYWLRKVRRLTAERTAILPINPLPTVQFAELPLSGKHSIASTCLSYHIHEIITRISFRSRNSRDSHYKL